MNPALLSRLIMAGLIVSIMISTSWAESERLKTEADKPSASKAIEPGNNKNVKDKPLVLADIVPLAGQLKSRLASLKKKFRSGLVITDVENDLNGIENRLKNADDRFRRMKDSKDYKFYKLVELKETIKREVILLKNISISINTAARQLEVWRTEWLTEKERWNDWKIRLDREDAPAPVILSFEKTTLTIQTALDLIIPRMEIILVSQEKTEMIRTGLYDLSEAIEIQLSEERRSALLDASPPIVSIAYFSQIRSSQLWYTARNRIDEISWIDRRFFDRQGWVAFLHVFIFVLMTTVLYRNREALIPSPHWFFLAKRPVSAGLFIGYMTTILLYEYGGTPGSWKIANILVIAVAFSRLMECLIEENWKKKFVYGVMLMLVLTRSMDLLSFPLPLFRLLTFSASLVCLFFCLRFAAESTSGKTATLWTRLLRLMALVFVIILLAEFWGKKALAIFIFASLIRSIAIVLAFILFMHIIRGGIAWVVLNSPVRKSVFVRNSDPQKIILHASRLVDVVIIGVILLPVFLMAWSAYDSLGEASRALMSMGFSLGSKQLTVQALIMVAGILYAAFILSWGTEKLLTNMVLAKRQMEMGVRLSIARLLHYVILATGFLMALSALGFEVAKFTLMLSALGVGIGFGLQGIVNNFVSGLILLFERPVRVGDFIEISGKWAKIKRIGIRSTMVQTLDQADLIIPNSDLINNQVTNWTLSNRQVRLSVAVGVAYGSDVPLVMETLKACANANTLVTKYPSPQVLFMNFGESSLDFEIRVWVLNADFRLEARSQIHQEIDRRFREEKIEIAFPQRDVHLKTDKEPVRSTTG